MSRPVLHSRSPSYARLTEGELLSSSQSLLSPSLSNLRAVLVSSTFITLTWDLPQLPTKHSATSYTVIWREAGQER